MAKGGLPRAEDSTRPREAFDLLVLAPVEHLTTALRRGQPFSERALHDMLGLSRRLDAFRDALEARMGDDDVIEEN